MKTEPATPTLKTKIETRTPNAMADVPSDKAAAAKAKPEIFEALAKSKPAFSNAEVDTAEGFSSDNNSALLATELASVPRRHRAKYRQYREEQKKLAASIKHMGERMKTIDSILASMHKL